MIRNILRARLALWLYDLADEIHPCRRDCMGTFAYDDDGNVVVLDQTGPASTWRARRYARKLARL